MCAKWLRLLLPIVAMFPWPAAANNDVLPRLFNNIPIDRNFLSVSYTRSRGNVAVDPGIALDVEADLHTYTASYSRSFALFGQSAMFTAVMPYADLTLSGIVLGQRVTVSDDRVPDPTFRLAMNLSGAPALSVEEFAGYRQKTIVGFNLQVSPPLGHYDDSRRVNFGSNRWTISPELGFSRRIGRFSLEGAGSVIFFTDNDDYLASGTLEQEPIALVRANLIYHLARPGTWIGLSGLYLRGGETTINRVDRNDLQATSRVGATVSVPFAGRHNLMFKLSSGVTTRIGADFDTYQLTYTYSF